LLQPVEGLYSALDRAEFLHRFQLLRGLDQHAQAQQGLATPVLEGHPDLEVRRRVGFPVIIDVVVANPRRAQMALT
jgi:hypothetical protein